ncbi:MAG: hypothetical protein RR340_09095 [Cloacibacillus sp.]
MEWFASQPAPLQALMAGIFTWGLTTLGAGGVFFAHKPSQKVLDVMLGFAGGVMIAASYWSLLAPAIGLSRMAASACWLSRRRLLAAAARHGASTPSSRNG